MTDPDPEVSAKVQRRRFPAEYRLRILKEADACKKPGEVGALLRREGLYSSLLTNWRRQREAGALREMRGRRRGPTPRPVDPRVKQLETENRRLQRKLQRAETIITLQKKRFLSTNVCTILPQQLGHIAGRGCRCAHPRIICEVVCRSVDGRLRGPRS